MANGNPLDEPQMRNTPQPARNGTALRNVAPLAGVLVPAVVVALALFQLWNAADQNGTTAKAIIQSVGPASLLIGIVAPLLPLIFLGFAFLASSIYQGRRTAREFVSDDDSLWTFSFGFTALVFLVPWNVALIVGVIALFLLYIWWGLSKLEPESSRADGSSPGEISSRVFCTVAGVLILLLLFSQSIGVLWLPAQRITVDRHSFTGYVLASDSRWTSILMDKGRAVKIVDTASIKRREICTPRGGWWTRFDTPAVALGLPAWLGPAERGHHYPRC